MKRRAVRSDHQYWQGWSLGQLRAFVAEHRDVGDEALLLAVTETGTAPLRGIGFFSMPLRRDGGR
ncbi:hypothetical protein [Actinoplanes sp. NPDC049599]|uniref:hypothetical protein n=1 Tax=Actinoplanes sp. NPDC049599 TaxID=3363903 RepID=UPI0037B8E378